MLMEWLLTVEDLALLRTIRRSGLLYAMLNGTHILGLSLLLGAIAAFDLKVLGLLGDSTRHHLKGLLSLARIGFTIAVITGVLLAALRISAYIYNPAFLIKMGLIAIALCNVIAFTWISTQAARHDWLRGSALLSLILWIAVLYSGRWIGFI